MMPYVKLAMIIVRMLGLPWPYTLSPDRTNWKVGAVDFRVHLHLPSASSRLIGRNGSAQ